MYVGTIYWDRLTTGTDLLGLVAELVAYGLGMHSGFLYFTTLEGTASYGGLLLAPVFCILYL